MKNVVKLAILLALLVALVLPGAALAKGLGDDKVVFGGTYTLEAGQSLNGNLAVLGGTATLESGSTVEGDIALMGGTLEASGLVEGSIVGLGGLIVLKDTAVIEKDVIAVGAHIDKAEGAEVEGDLVNTIQGPMAFNFPAEVSLPRLKVTFAPILDVMWFLFKVFMWAALATLVAIFFPNYVERTGRAGVGQPLVSGGLGLLTALIVPVILVVLAVTIILIPASLLGVMALVVAWFFGVVALGLETGKRIGLILKQEWPVAVSAAVGTFVLVFVMDGTRALVPCFGWTIPAVIGVVGLGAVLLTRFGTQEYTPYTPARPLPPPPPLPPAPPAKPPISFEVAQVISEQVAPPDQTAAVVKKSRPKKSPAAPAKPAKVVAPPAEAPVEAPNKPARKRATKS